MSIDMGSPNSAAERPDAKEGPAPPRHAVAIDPVCGMKVDPAKAAGRLEHAGTSYYFCGRSCLEKFRAEPAKYWSRPGGSAFFDRGARATQGAGGSWNRLDLPDASGGARAKAGACPLCGMALEPVTPTAQKRQIPSSPT